MLKKLFALLAPVFGVLFIYAYIKSSTVDVVYTDYIRLINSYLPDVWSLKPYMHADVLTRLPINYIERIVNVTLFRYSTSFDMYLGAIFLGLTAFITIRYAAVKNLHIFVLISLSVVVFSLNKWEMLTNGSGWVHFASVAIFFYHFYVYDRAVCSNRSNSGYQKLIVIPWIAILLFAGPYSVGYVGTLTVVYIIDMFTKRNKKNIKRHMVWLVNSLIPLALYIYSRLHSIEEHAGATDRSFSSVFKEMPTLFLTLPIKSFASGILGSETISRYAIPDIFVIILGIAVICMYIYAVRLYIVGAMHKKSIFPLCLLVSGLISHILVLMASWIFLNDTYGMSSRYALQFQCGILGIILILSIYKGYKQRSNMLLTAIILICLV